MVGVFCGWVSLGSSLAGEVVLVSSPAHEGQGVLVSSPAHEGQGGTATLARAPEVQAVSRCMHMCRCMHVCSRGGAYDVHAFAGYMQGCMRACRLQKCGEEERKNKREIRVSRARLPEKSVCGLGFGHGHGEKVSGTWRKSAGARARCGRHRRRGRGRNGPFGPSRACAPDGGWLARHFAKVTACPPCLSSTLLCERE